MKTHVDFEFSKKYAGVYVKGDKKSFYRPMARELQDVQKVGKIIGETVTADELKLMDAEKAAITKLTNEKDEALKEKVKAEKALVVANNKIEKLTLANK